MELTKNVAPYVHFEKKIINGVEVSIMRTNIRMEPPSKKLQEANEILKRMNFIDKSKNYRPAPGASE